MGKGGFKYGGGIVNPDEVYAEMMGERHERFLIINVDAHLWRLAKIQVTRMYVKNEVGTFQVFNYLIGSLFGKRTMLYARKDTVHVEVEVGDATLYGVYAERIEGWINLNRAVKLADIRLNNTHKFVAHHLSLEFVTVGTSHDTDALRACTVLNYVLLYAKLLINRQF